MESVKNLQHIHLSETIQATAFTTASGRAERWILVRAKSLRTLETMVNELCSDYQWALKTLGIENNTAVFSRLYVRDMAKQLPALKSWGFPNRLINAPVSVVEQSPLWPVELLLWAYHISDIKSQMLTPVDLGSQGLAKAILAKGTNYSFVWGANFTDTEGADSRTQTTRIFTQYQNLLNSNGMTLLGSSVRTWIHVRDIDKQYQGMVAARKDFFENHGLNSSTRFIASTGIGAGLVEPNCCVSLDFLNIAPLLPAQIVRMEALENLGPTLEYGVTFERGTKILFGDRDHLYISGTASINLHGEVLFPGDAQKQTIRTLDNILALLEPHGCEFKDVAYFMVYIRNPTDREAVLAGLESRLPSDIPFAFVCGAVCRPAWLVEIECFAVKAANNPFPSFN